MSSNKNITRKNRKTYDPSDQDPVVVPVSEPIQNPVPISDEVPELEPIQDPEEVPEEVLEEDLKEIELLENNISLDPIFEKKFKLQEYAKMIDKEINDLKPPYTYININYFSYIEIDGIPVRIYVGKEKYKKTYKFLIVVEQSVIESEDTRRKNRDIVLYSDYNYKDVCAVLEHIEEVKKSYKLIEHYLKSPFGVQFVQTQREIYPIPPDKKCSVCYEPTIEYSVCKHPICFRCRYECIMSKNIMCPICRNGTLKLFPKELALEDETE